MFNINDLHNDLHSKVFLLEKIIIKKTGNRYVVLNVSHHNSLAFTTIQCHRSTLLKWKLTEQSSLSTVRGYEFQWLPKFWVWGHCLSLWPVVWNHTQLRRWFWTTVLIHTTALSIQAHRRNNFRLSTGGSLRFVAGGHHDPAPRHMGGHVLNKCSCVESPSLKTAGQIHAHRRSICPVPGP